MERYLYKSNSGNYNFLMAYPAIEEFALASLGYLWLYKIADTHEGINAIRCSTDNVVISKKIDSIAFSMSFDFDYAGVFEILEKLNIPLYSAERNENHPLIFAGGPVITTNPCPYEAFFDFLMIGDGEESFKHVLDILKSNSRCEALKLLENVDGVYIPGKNKTVKKAVVPLHEVIYTPILSDKGYFKDTFIIEVERGCMNRCAFCTASYINLPFRSYEYDKIIAAVDLGLQYTNKIALLGAQISAHPDFDAIMKYIEDKIDNGVNIELGISSLRTDAVSPQMVQTLVKGGQKHSTIAIEAASERLRKYINKNLKEEQKVNVIKELIESVKYLSKTRTGALMVLEREEDVNSYSDVGIQLDAVLSTELILTIFHPNTPLHDGAVVISGDTIKSAGVLLPLTEDPKLSWKYGTRHRAAIGMSEASESACLVVSEETGDVSIAMDGTLKKYEDLVTLKSDLEHILGYHEKNDDNKKTIFKINNLITIRKNVSKKEK